MITRDIAPILRRAATQFPAVTLTGPRQSGKTTLCRALFLQHPYVNLEAPDVRAFAAADPRAFLAQYPHGAIFDEVQRVPDLLSYLQGLIDTDPEPGQWILTGSQNFLLLESISQSLAGRTAVHHLLPLTRSEILRSALNPSTLEDTLHAGGFPRIFDRGLEPETWLRSYVATYLERDVRTLGSVGDLGTFQRFLELCAGRTAQLLKYSSLANDCGISQPTAKAWINLLEASFVAFRLPAFHSNMRKRLVKMPKLYFHDTGLACWLLGIRSSEQLRSHPLRGPIFETWVVSEVLKHRTNQGITGGLSFYRDSNGAEADLVIEQEGKITLVEAKSNATPSPGLLSSTKRVHGHLAELPQPCEVAVAYGGNEFQQHSSGQIVPWGMLPAVALPGFAPSVQAYADGKPLVGVDILALFPNKTWKRATTDETGLATIKLHSSHLPMTVFASAPGYAARVEHGWIPATGALHLDIDSLSAGGSVSFADRTGHVPGLDGQLNPIRDAQDRTYLYAKNIAINGGEQQPVVFALGQELQLTDAEGSEISIRIIEIVGDSALIEYRTPL